MKTLEDLDVSGLSERAQAIVEFVKKGGEALEQFVISEDGQSALRETLPLLEEKVTWLRTLAENGGLGVPGVAAKVHFYVQTLGEAFNAAAVCIQEETRTYLKAQDLDPRDLVQKLDAEKVTKAEVVGAYL